MSSKEVSGKKRLALDGSQNRSRDRPGALQDQLRVADAAFGKAAFAVAKIIVPQPQKCLVEAEGENFLIMIVNVFAPFCEGADVVGSDLFEVDQAQI